MHKMGASVEGLIVHFVYLGTLPGVNQAMSSGTACFPGAHGSDLNWDQGIQADRA